MEKMEIKKAKGRPKTGRAMTAAERQKASRQKRKLEKFESFPPSQISILLSGQASQALQMLAIYRDTSQKEVIEKLLIEEYQKTTRQPEPPLTRP